MWPQFLTIHMCFFPLQKPLMVAKERDWLYYKDAFALDLIYLHTLVFQPIIYNKWFSPCHTIELDKLAYHNSKPENQKHGPSDPEQGFPHNFPRHVVQARTNMEPSMSLQTYMAML